MEAVQTIALMMGTAWASGINLYATVLVLGWMGSTGQVDLPPALEILTEPSVMFAAGLMYCVEFFADKVPGVDTGWDAIHTFIRIPAGAIMAAGAAQGLDVGPAAELTALLLGGALSATSHATKAGTRVLINTSPEPVSNWTASITEDLAVIGGLWASLNHPYFFLGALLVFLLVVAWLLPKIWRAIKRVFRAVRRWFTGTPDDKPTHNPAEEFEQRRHDVLRELYEDKSGNT
ncbi:MAG TPA: DUF4126 domain-containing protein [Gammaproteobacteria bacterium]|nr:DUF4126 domain-containing protein [Gammaproteobacteria bacterium]